MVYSAIIIRSNHSPGVSFLIFCSVRNPNEYDGWWSTTQFSGAYEPGAIQIDESKGEKIDKGNKFQLFNGN